MISAKSLLAYCALVSASCALVSASATSPLTTNASENADAAPAPRPIEAAPRLPAPTHLILNRHEPLSPKLQGTWQRLADEATIQAGSNISDLASGVYQTPLGRRALIASAPASSPGATELARGLRGIAVQVHDSPEAAATAAMNLRAVDAWSLLILNQYLYDGLPWPWPRATDQRPLRGLASLLKRSTPWWGSKAEADGSFGSFPDLHGQPIIVSGDPDFMVCGVLVADDGQRGRLDPADRVISTAFGTRVVELALGELLDGPTSYLHIATLNAEKITTWAKPPHKATSPLWDLTPGRIWMVLVGMLLIILSLRRLNRRQRR
jgi:hypothetical protein